jgi:putative membrane protein
MDRERTLTAIVTVALMSASGLIAPAMAQTKPAAPPAATGSTAPARVVLNKRDRDFIGNAAHGGLAEIDLSKLAQKSANPDVRRFADRMIADHTKIGERLATIAQADGVDAPQTLDIEHQKLREKLANEHDGTFDREYAHAMVVDHDQAIKLFQQEEERPGHDVQLTRFARSTLPTLQEHRRMAVALADKLAATAAR